MDAETAAIYERCASQWVAKRRPHALEDGRLEAFARRVRRGRIADLGCGPGWYAEQLRVLGFQVVAMDAVVAMLAEAGRRFPQVVRVRGDLMAPPFADQSLDGAWGSNCYQHLPRHDLPLALARLHRALRPGAAFEITLGHLTDTAADGVADGEHERRIEDISFPGRLFSLHTAARARALLEGAGFGAIRITPLPKKWMAVRARRRRTLPDFVQPRLRLLVCGLNPSLYSADRGVPFARPGNRWWPAVKRAGLVAREYDVDDALQHGVGFTDLVKRATAGAAELERREYAKGIKRVEALVRLAQPNAICFVGLDGWRAAVDRRAQPGWIVRGFGGRPAYLMPSTSGRNARTSLADLAAHLRRAATEV